MNILIRLIEFQLQQKLNIKRVTAVTNQFPGNQATSEFAVVMKHYRKLPIISAPPIVSATQK